MIQKQPLRKLLTDSVNAAPACELLDQKICLNGRTEGFLLGRIYEVQRYHLRAVDADYILSIPQLQQTRIHTQGCHTRSILIFVLPVELTCWLRRRVCTTNTTYCVSRCFEVNLPAPEFSLNVQASRQAKWNVCGAPGLSFHFS